MRWAALGIVLIGVVLVPFFLFGQQFNEFTARITAGESSRWISAAAIFSLLMFDVVLPVPSSIVSTAAGVLLGLVSGAAVVWGGMMAGCGVAYLLGLHGAPFARRLVGEDRLEWAADLARRYGDLTIVLCRPVPVLAEATVVFAGIIGMPLTRFTALTALSNLGIAVGYSALGALSLSINSFLVAFFGAMLLPALFFLMSRMTFGRAATRPPSRPRGGSGDLPAIERKSR